MIAAALVGAVMAASVIIAILAGKPWKLGGSPEMVRRPLGDTGITVEVPSDAPIETVPRNEVPTFQSGTPDNQPVAFMLRVVPLKGTLEELRKDIEDAPPGKWRRTSPASYTTAGARPAVVTTFDAEGGVKVRMIAFIDGDRLIVVQGYARKDRPKSWVGIEEKVAASVARR
jgi:hypothetical protein